MTIETLDLEFQGEQGLIAAFLIESGGERVLIETGPGSCLPVLLRALAERRVSPSDIRCVLVTHAHLDHAGAAGWWARQGVEVVCHPRAARHLVNPGKLVEGARAIYGAEFDRLWGETLGAPEERVRAVEDGEEVRVGRLRIKALDTPGHARHHHAYAVEGVCFAGDVAGVRLAGSAYVSVAAAPPQFDLAAYRGSLVKLRDEGFERLFLTHFGEVQDVPAHWRSYERRVEEVAEQARLAWLNGESEARWVERFTSHERAACFGVGGSEAHWAKYEQINGTAMCVQGLRLWAEALSGLPKTRSLA